MSSNEQSPRLHPSTMDAFYQQQVHVGSSFDRFPASYQNPAMTFPGFAQTSYNNFIPSRQSSNTLPSIGNFADPLSYLPYPSHLGSSHSTDRREPLPEFSSIVSSMSEGVPKLFPYPTQEQQSKRHNSSIPTSLAHVYATHVPQSDSIDHSDLSPSPSPALSQIRHPVQKSYTSQQYAQLPTNYSRYQEIPSHRLHSETEQAYAAPQSVSPHLEVNRYNTPTNLSMSSSTEPKYDSYKSIPSSFPREPYPLQTSDAEDDRLIEKLKHPKKSRKRLSNPKPIKKDKPFVAFNLMGKLEMSKKKSTLPIESRDISIQTDKSLMINDLNIATLKRRIYNTPVPIATKEPQKENKEENPDNKTDKPFNILSTDDIDEYQNQKNKSIKEVSGEAFSETTEDAAIDKTNGRPNKTDELTNVKIKTAEMSAGALENDVKKNFIPKVPLPELGNLTPGMINSLPLAAFKGKDKDAEMERMEINVRIDDSQYVSVDDGPKRWKCNQCPKSYTTKHNLVTHVMDHNGIKPHLCMICGKYFKQLSHLNTHMLTHENTKPNICPICGKGFTQVSHVKRHQAVHTENKPHVCDVCNRGFSYPSELRIHKQRQHVPGKEKCPECDEVFDSIKQLKDHLASHEQREDHECPECNKLFRYPSQLKDHLSSHSGHRPFICSECGMDFIKEHHLKAHAFTHTGLRPYECPQCGRTFNQRANMIRHQLIHSNDRAYKCEECDKSFTQPQTLKAHMVVHADKKPHQCHLCGKEFGRQHNLQAHMHMHSDSKPFLCFCGSSFTLKGNLKRHKKVKHGIDDSTESMEEEAVSFLSTMSSRANHSLTINVPTEDQHESSPEHGLLSPDSRLQRKQRKSIPRKIPQPDSDSLEDEEDPTEDEEKDNDKEDEDDNQKSRFFTALNHPRSSGKLLAMKRSFATSRDSDEAEADDDEEYDSEPIDKTPKKMRKTSVTTEGSDNEDGDSRKYGKKSRNKSLTTDGSEEDDEEVEEEADLENDSDWIPKHIKPRVTKGKKLASVLAEKFSRSNLNK